MTVQDSKNEGNPLRFWRFIKKIIIWSVILFVLEKVFEKVISYSGLDTWSKFEKSTNKLDSVLLNKMEKVSPISLFYDLRSARGISIIDTAASNAVDRYNFQIMQTILRGEHVSGPMDKYYHPEYHEVTIWEKIRDWGRGFWYNDNNTANWFGRIILFISLLVAIPLTETTKTNHQSTYWVSDFYLLNILVALLYFTLFFFLLYYLMEFILFIAGSIVALFSTLAAAGGIASHFLKELKVETMAHLKKKIGP